MKQNPKSPLFALRGLTAKTVFFLGLLCAHSLLAGEIIVNQEPRAIGKWHAIIGGGKEPRYLAGSYPKPWAAGLWDEKAEAEFTLGEGPDGRHCFGLINLNPVPGGQWTRSRIKLKTGTYVLTFDYYTEGQAHGRFGFRFYGSAFATGSTGGNAEADGSFSFPGETKESARLDTWKKFQLTFKVAANETEMGIVFQNRKPGSDNKFYFTDLTVERVGD